MNSPSHETFELTLISPERVIFSGAQTSVQIPSEEGDAIILAGYMPMVIMLRPGLLRLNNIGDGKETDYFISGGFADVNNTSLKLLITSPQPLSTLDRPSIAAKLQGIEQAIELSEDDADKVELVQDRKIALGMLDALDKGALPFKL